MGTLPGFHIDDVGPMIGFAEPGEGTDTMLGEAPVVHENEERRAMAALVAEVAAVECAAPVEPKGEPHELSVEAKPEPCIVPAVTAALEEGVTEKNTEVSVKRSGGAGHRATCDSRRQGEPLSDRAAGEAGDGLGTCGFPTAPFSFLPPTFWNTSPPTVARLTRRP